MDAFHWIWYEKWPQFILVSYKKNVATINQKTHLSHFPNIYLDLDPFCSTYSYEFLYL